ncbi:MAG: bifunctional glycosyltransferase family 2/GtrA family protein [Halobacteriota archaeon]
MLKPLRIAAVVPVYQEPLAIRRLINEFMSHIFANSDNVELFIFEDGSTDSTKEVLREFENQAIPRLHISISGKRKGYPTAARDAILSIDPSIYTHILFLDGDGQYYIEDVQKFVSIAESGSNPDIIVGQRRERAEPLYRRILTRGLRIIESALFVPQIRDVTSALRLMKTTIARDIASQVVYSGYNFWLEFTARMSALDVKVIEIPVGYKQREQGASHVYSPRKMLKVVSNELCALIRVFIAQRMTEALTFAFVGASGAVVILLLTWIFTEYAHLFYLLSAALAIEISILWAFVLNTTITFRHSFKKRGDLLLSFVNYQVVALGGFTINVLLLYALTTFFGIFYFVSEIVAIAVAFGFNYLMSLRFVWKHHVAS